MKERRIEKEIRKKKQIHDSIEVRNVCLSLRTQRKLIIAPHKARPGSGNFRSFFRKNLELWRHIFAYLWPDVLIIYANSYLDVLIVYANSYLDVYDATLDFLFKQCDMAINISLAFLNGLIHCWHFLRLVYVSVSVNWINAGLQFRYLRSPWRFFVHFPCTLVPNFTMPWNMRHLWKQSIKHCTGRIFARLVWRLFVWFFLLLAPYVLFRL